MDEALKINNYKTNNPVPKKEFVPDITACYYTTKKGVRTTNFYHLLDGKVYKKADPKEEGYSNTIPSNYYPTIPMRKDNFRIMLYVEYVRSDEMLVVRTIKIKGDKPDTKINRDTREWEWDVFGCGPEYEHEFYLFKGNSTPYTGDGNPYKPDFQGRYYNREFVKKLNYMMKWDMANISHHEWRDFFDIKQPSDGGEVYGTWRIDSYYNRVDQYKNMQPRNPSKTAEELDELLKINLKPMSDYAASCPSTEFIYKKDRWSNTVMASNWCVYEEINSENAVLRFLSKSHRSSVMGTMGISETPQDIYDSFDSEAGRIYLTPKTILCAEKSGGKFIKTRIDCVGDGWYTRLLNPEQIYNHSFFKGKEDMVKLLNDKSVQGRYDNEVIKNLPGLFCIGQVINLMRTPTVTLFIKDNNPMLSDSKCKIGRLSDHINNKFDISPTSKKEDYKALFNMNKYQVELISGNEKWITAGSQILQNLFGDEMSSWTKEETDKNFLTAQRMADGGYYRWILYLSSEKGYFYPNRKHDNMSKEMKDEAIKNFKICAENVGAISIMKDVGLRLGRTWDNAKYDKAAALWKAATNYEEFSKAYDEIVKIV